MYSKAKYKYKKHFCMNCLQCFSIKQMFTDHHKVCLEIHVKEATKMPEKDSNVFFFYLGFLSRFTGLQGRRGYLSPFYHFHSLHRHLDISRVITGESSPLNITSSHTRTGNLRFPNASH